jgi:hypothetical protein
MRTTLGDSWFEAAKELQWMYRCDGVKFSFLQRVHKNNLGTILMGQYSEFSYKAGSVALIKGFDVKGYLVLISPRALTEDELFDLSIKLA